MNIQTFKYTPILGWSASRYDTFTQCKRQYYYQYYGKHDQSQFEKISQLKNLTSMPLIIGILVHEVMKTILQRLQKSTQKIDTQRFQTFLYQQTVQQCREKIFSEVYYGERSAIDIQQILSQVESCLHNFLNSSRFEWIQTTAILTKDQWIIEPPGYGEARMGDLKIYCKVDCLFPTQDKIVIIDWKTGKPDHKKHSQQLTGYAAWATCHEHLSAKAINPMAVYLQPTYQETCVTLNELDLATFKEQVVINQTKEMYAFCQDINENTPVEKNLFPMNSHLKSCRFCNFRELCYR